MKKFKILSILFAMALILTGCATVSNVVDKNGKAIYLDEIQYNQGHVVEVGDYLYYGNGYSATTSDEFNYKNSAKYGYLARLNTSEDLKFDDDVDLEYINSTSPNGVDKVNDKLIGYQSQDMFALGSYIYFTSANTHKTSSLENDYTQVSLFRVKFNGDGFKELGTYKHDENSIITVQKGSDNNYYYIITEPAEESTYNIFSIKIGDSLGEEKQLNKYEKDGEEVVDAIETVAIADENSSIKNIIYTVTSDSTEIDTDAVKAVDFATGEVKTLDNGVAGATISLEGREGDVVFYAYTYKAITEIYFKDLVNSDNYYNPTASNKFYNATEIKNIDSVGNGYVFVSASSSSLIYNDLDTTSDGELLLTTSEYTDILFTDGDYVYYSNATSIGRISVVDKIKETIVTMTDIVSGVCGYTGDYIYFYAKLEEVKESEETESEESKEDTNYYMYRTDKLGNYQLVGQTIEK